MFSGGRKMERYANPSTSSSTAATTMLMDSNNDDSRFDR